MTTVDDQYANTAYIYYPAYLGDHNDLHSTIMWLGDVVNAPYTPAELLSVLHRFSYAPGRVAITGMAWFGEREDVPVATLLPVELMSMQLRIAQTLKLYGAVSASEFNYNPHITLPTWDMVLPDYAYLAAPVLKWKGKLFTF